jgi:hypothetical protein
MGLVTNLTGSSTGFFRRDAVRAVTGTAAGTRIIFVDLAPPGFSS